MGFDNFVVRKFLRKLPNAVDNQTQGDDSSNAVWKYKAPSNIVDGNKVTEAYSEYCDLFPDLEESLNAFSK